VNELVFSYRFEKILSVRTMEKNEAVNSYHQAVRRFEEAAQGLYRLLKEKEELEAEREKRIRDGLSVDRLREFQRYLANLQREIDHYQQLVIRARDKMNEEYRRLVEKNVEVKKYERMKEKDYQMFLQLEKWKETKDLDEISSRSALRRNGW